MKYLSELRPLADRSWFDFPRSMSEFFRAFPPAGDGDTGRFTPRVDVLESTESYAVKVEVPGMNPKDIQVNLVGDTLTIKGERKREETRDTDHWHVVERSFGSFERSFSFPSAVRSDDVEAEVKDGILTIQVHKAKEALPKQIPIRTK